MAPGASAKASAKKGASPDIVVKHVLRKNQIIAAIEFLAMTQTGTRSGPLCRVCTGALGDEPVGNCPVCGWRRTQRCVKPVRRKYLIALACCAVGGIWAVPVMRVLRFSPALTTHVLSHLTQNWRQAKIIGNAIRPILTDLGPSPSFNTWPTQQWPLTGEPNMFTEYSPDQLLSLFHEVESDAWDAFRKARWGQRAKGWNVRCPFCQARSITCGSRQLGQNERQPIMRWWCRTSEDREACNGRQRSRYRRHTDIRRRGVNKRFDGCGKYFSDLTGTPLNRRQVPMSEWMLLVKGGPLAIAVLREAGVSAVQCSEMVAALCTIATETPRFMARLQATYNVPFMMVMMELDKNRADGANMQQDN